MVKIPLSYISFLSTNYFFLTMFFNLRFRIYDLHTIILSHTIILRIFCPLRLSFSFPLPLLFRFIFFLISHLFFFLSLFFSSPNLHHFLNLVCHFLRAPLPCFRTFCCPGGNSLHYSFWNTAYFPKQKFEQLLQQNVSKVIQI